MQKVKNSTTQQLRDAVETGGGGERKFWLTCPKSDGRQVLRVRGYFFILADRQAQ
jgi:hypothetical protein